MPELIVWLHSSWLWIVGAVSFGAGALKFVEVMTWLKARLPQWRSLMFGSKAVVIQLAKNQDQISELAATVQLIAKEFKPNSGSSLRDMVNNIDKQLILNDQRFKAMVLDAASGIMEFAANGELLWCNRTFQRMVVRDMSELLGYGWTNAVLEADRDIVKDEWIEAVKQGRSMEQVFRLCTPDGEVIPISARATVMRSQRQIIGFVMTLNHPVLP